MNKSFWIGTAVGGIVGAALGLLFAPKTGRELRREAAGAVRRAGDDVRKAAGRAADWADGVRNRFIGVRVRRPAEDADGEAAG